MSAPQTAPTVERFAAPSALWRKCGGHSAAGGAAREFGNQFADRTMAVVLLHSAGGGGEPTKASIQIPTLIFHGGKDTNVPPNGPQDFWTRGRSAGGPWTFVVEPMIGHAELTDEAINLMTSWITAVARQRLDSNGGPLRPAADSWLGNNQTCAITPAQSFSGSKYFTR
jgi:pimeloyl-ACP methyl ester carboxylesterase